MKTSTLMILGMGLMITVFGNSNQAHAANREGSARAQVIENSFTRNVAEISAEEALLVASMISGEGPLNDGQRQTQIHFEESESN